MANCKSIILFVCVAMASSFADDPVKGSSEKQFDPDFQAQELGQLQELKINQYSNHLRSDDSPYQFVEVGKAEDELSATEASRAMNEKEEPADNRKAVLLMVMLGSFFAFVVGGVHLGRKVYRARRRRNRSRNRPRVPLATPRSAE